MGNRMPAWRSTFNATGSLLFLAVALTLLYFVAVNCHAAVIFTRRAPPAGWSIERRADSTAEVEFFLALKQQNLDVLDGKFWAVSDPTSAQYRQFLSIDEINAIVAAKPEHMREVTNWLLINGVAASQISNFADALEVRTSVAVAERIFQTEFYQFRHLQSQRTAVKQYGSFAVPDSIRPMVELVTGISNFPVPIPHGKSARQRSQRSNSGTTPMADPRDFAVVPQSTYGMYGVPPYNSSSPSVATSQGAIEFVGQSFSDLDLQVYSRLVGIPITPLTADHIVGPNEGYEGTEATLDVQTLAAVDTQAATWFWAEEDSSWMYGFCEHFFNTANVPLVISISYGWWELDQCEVAAGECVRLGVNDAGYVARVNTEFQKLGTRGITVLAGSGDAGAHTRSDNECEADSLRVDFPASSPYVTSVGATQLNTMTKLTNPPELCTLVAKDQLTCAGSGQEVAVSYDVASFSSGGGFSSVAAMPDYQSGMVNAYLSSGVKLPPSSYYNGTNRAHPDVSAIGNNWLIYDWEDGGYDIDAGTSVSAPIFAAIISLLNQASIAKSGKPLGFINPLLYQIAARNPQAFNDITVGSNICSELGCYDSCTGYVATKGWDPVTGLGTPNYQVLLQEINKMNAGTATEMKSERC